MEGKYLEVFIKARPYLEVRDNIIHTRVAYSFAVKLLAAEGGDEEVVLPAVILHDVGWSFLPEELHLKAFGPRKPDLELNRVHEVEGSRKAREILEELDYNPALVGEIVEIILGHDSREEALSLNDALVKDSDRLWRYSEEALSIDPKRFGIDPGVHADWLKHRIESWFYTETAKKLATEEQRLRAITYPLPPKQDARSGSQKP